MIGAKDFIEPAKASGFEFWAGVPCSFLTPFINSVINDPGMTYVSSANEGDAVAAATGAALAGQGAVAMMQNSGLGNAVSPLSSLNWVFRIPVLLIITLRGEPGRPDEPQHELMGRITGDLLDRLQIPWDWFPAESDAVEDALMVARSQMMKTGLPYAFVMRKGSVAPTGLEQQPRSRFEPATVAGAQQAAPELSRTEALEAVIENTPEDESIVVGTTGYTGRELFALNDRPNQFYMVGSMGCASSLGLGLSMALPYRQVVVVDGDGAMLMRMGNLATAGTYAGDNFHHIVLDNGMHESTGGQATVSDRVRFASIAASCGYRHARAGSSREDLVGFLRQRQGPGLLHLLTRPGVPENLPRPDIGPIAVSRRLMRQLDVEVPWMNA